MKVLILNTSDTKGGAARAALRLHKGFHKIDVDSSLLVQSKQSGYLNVVGESAASGITQAKQGLRLTFDNLPLKFYKGYDGATFSSQWLPDSVLSKVNKIDPEVVNLHWINAGFLNIETISKFNRPVVWTLHDMWPFTGGCHYNQMCDRYQQSCGACPQLGSSKQRDLSRKIWNRKGKTFRDLNLTVVTPSHWLAECARKSSLFKDFRVECIPNGIDTSLYRPIDKRFAREVLRLPQDKQLILFGSLNATSDRRKGFHLLQPALQFLGQDTSIKDQIELVVFGANGPANSASVFAQKTHYLGSFGDDLSLSLIYSAADVFVLPSIQENLANTVMEALACGTPCVAFNIGGMPDMIEHQQNGYLTAPYEFEDLANGIRWVLSSLARSENSVSTLSKRSRDKVVEEFDQKIQATRYLTLMRSLKR